MKAVPAGELSKIDAALKAGNKIEAIKVYREATQCGLAEAKTDIEAYADDLHAKMPESFPAAKKSGCAAVLMLAVLLAGAGLTVLLRVLS